MMRRVTGIKIDRHNGHAKPASVGNAQAVRGDVATGPATSLRPDTARWQIAVKSFRRFGAVRRLIDSIRHFYPDVEILIADDSFEQPDAEPPAEVRAIQDMPGVTWYQLPFDSGVTAGRKFLFEQATADYVLV